MAFLHIVALILCLCATAMAAAAQNWLTRVCAHLVCHQGATRGKQVNSVVKWEEWLADILANPEDDPLVRDHLRMSKIAFAALHGALRTTPPFMPLVMANSPISSLVAFDQALLV